MIWVVIAILFFLAAAFAPILFVGVIGLVIWVSAKSLLYPSEENSNDTSSRNQSNSYDKPWETKYQKPEDDIVLYLEEKPWNCESEEYPKDSGNDIDVWEEYDLDVKHAELLAKKLKSKLVIENEFWEQWGLEFKCNLIGYGTDLRINYEVIDRTGQIKENKDVDFWVQFNFYDNEGNLLLGSEYDINMTALRQNRTTDYALFIARDISAAESMLIYGYRGF